MPEEWSHHGAQFDRSVRLALWKPPGSIRLPTLVDHANHENTKREVGAGDKPVALQRLQ
jgi:hypothetical protein